MTKPPICAIFLTKFDVHKGYELIYYKSIDNIYDSKDLEFKSIPSGLHSVESDVICFTKNGKIPESLLYGLSVFKQNSLQLKDVVDRSKVKMYSLGILIDPRHLKSIDEFKNWDAKIYSCMWVFKTELTSMISEFIQLDTKEQEDDYLNKFESFFDNYKYKNEISKVHSSPQILSEDEIKSDHMVDSLVDIIDDFGPLIFKIWKISLLRKCIIINSIHDGNHNGILIGDICKIIFCISLISSIPKELQERLEKSSKKDLNDMMFNKPIYNICVNDIDTIVQMDTNYIACTTDQIITERKGIYDYNILLSKECPQIINAITGDNEYATFRDNEKFQIIYSQFNHDSNNNNNSSTTIIHPLSSKVSERRSIQELIWTGLSWWASAGESFSSHNEIFANEYEFFDNISSDKVERLISLVGYFQRITMKIFLVLIDRIRVGNEEGNDYDNDSEEDEDKITISFDPHDIEEMGLDPYSNGDCEFIKELVEVWWGIEVRIGGYFDDCCFCP